MSLQFGVNLNNREPLIAPDYDLPMLLSLSERVEELGFDSVWVGDSLFSKPRYEPIALLSAISQRTSRVGLGTACMVSSTRNPLYLALEWATLDQLSNGRTILGTGAGNPEEGVRREFAALGMDFSKRTAIFEEGLAAIRQLWTEGRVNLHGEHFDYDDVAFFSGTELGPLMPVQSPPPIWVVSNPRLVGKASPATMERRIVAACRRIVRYGDGWMTCCRAEHPEELVEQLGWIRKVADDEGADFDRLRISYQVTMNVGDSEEEARAAFGDYIGKYYPELSQAMDLGNWGPVGTPDQISDWLTTFAEAGVNHFVCRFGAIDQFGQVERFAREILPRFAAESEVSEMARVELLNDATLVVNVCMSIEADDVVTIICDDENREQAEAVAEVAVSRGAWPVIMNNEQQVRRGRADVRFPMAPPRNLHAAMTASDEVIIITNLEWANRFAHVSAVKETCAANGKICSIEPGMGSWNLTVDDLHTAIARAKHAMSVLEGKKHIHVTTPAGTDFHVSIEGRPSLEVTPIKHRGQMMGPVPLWAEVAYAAVETFTHGTAVVDGVMLGIGLEGQVKEPITWTMEGGRCVDIAGGDEAERLRRAIDGVENATVLGEFAFGVSDKAPFGTPSEKGRVGTVHMALGDNHNAYPGGQNVCSLHLDGVFLEATMQIEDDGTYILRDGAWAL